MIPHPSTQQLLEWHDGDRQAAREYLLNCALAYAKQEAQFLGLSINCEQDLRHHAKHHRCRNDGSNCLCVCHDSESTMKEKAS